MCLTAVFDGWLSSGCLSLRVKEGSAPKRLEAAFSNFAEWLTAADLGSVADIGVPVPHPVATGAHLQLPLKNLQCG